MPKEPSTLDSLLEMVHNLAARIETLEIMLAPTMQRKHTISVLKDVLDEGLQAMEDDEFVDDENEEDK